MKTRDAFALEKLIKGEVFDFKAVYALGEKDLKNRPQMKRLCFDGLYYLSELGRRVTNHVFRIQKYQTALMTKGRAFIDKEGGDETPRPSAQYIRACILGNVYSDFALRIKATEKDIEYLIEDIDFTGRRDFMKKFSERLREARRAAGLTQSELAQRIGIKRSTYGQFEQGRNEPNVSLLPELSRELNRPVEWFLGIKS